MASDYYLDKRQHIFILSSILQRHDSREIDWTPFRFMDQHLSPSMCCPCNTLYLRREWCVPIHYIYLSKMCFHMRTLSSKCFVIFSVSMMSFSVVSVQLKTFSCFSCYSFRNKSFLLRADFFAATWSAFCLIISECKCKLCDFSKILQNFL